MTDYTELADLCDALTRLGNDLRMERDRLCGIAAKWQAVERAAAGWNEPTVHSLDVKRAILAAVWEGLNDHAQ